MKKGENIKEKFEKKTVESREGIYHKCSACKKYRTLPAQQEKTVQNKRQELKRKSWVRLGLIANGMAQSCQKPGLDQNLVFVDQKLMWVMGKFCKQVRNLVCDEKIDMTI